MYVRGVRGATTVDNNESEQILTATIELLNQLVAENEIEPEAICSVFITVTHDLDATFPARAIRQMAGWELVPLMCSLEIPVQNSLEKCIRLMVLINTDRAQSDVQHVYLNNARALRPDLQAKSV